MEVLGKIGDEKAAWGRMRGHTSRKTVPGVVVIRLDVPLFWANATEIESRMLAELENWPDTHALVLDLEATSQLDTTSVDMLEHLHAELAADDIRLYLARVMHRVSEVLARSGFLDTLGDEHIWHSISQSVRAARKAVDLEFPDVAASETADGIAEAPGGSGDSDEPPDALDDETDIDVFEDTDEVEDEDEDEDEEIPPPRRWSWPFHRGSNTP